MQLEVSESTPNVVALFVRTVELQENERVLHDFHRFKINRQLGIFEWHLGWFEIRIELVRRRGVYHRRLRFLEGGFPLSTTLS